MLARSLSARGSEFERMSSPVDTLGTPSPEDDKAASEGIHQGVPPPPLSVDGPLLLFKENDQQSKGVDSEQLTDQLIELHKGRPIKLQVKVLVPVHDHPNFNFVGKLLGPKGNSLKRLQDATQTRMAILGKGSMRNKEKEEELRNLGDPKHYHLHQELHVEISTFAPAAEAYARIAHALTEVKRFLVPDYYDDIRQHQLRELALLNGDKKPLHADIGNGTSALSPLSSPNSNTSPTEPLRIFPPPPPQLHSPHKAVVHLSGSSVANERPSRVHYTSYRPAPPVVSPPPYHGVPFYGKIEAEPPTLIIPEHEDAGYDDGYGDDVYDALYENDFSSLGDIGDTEFLGPVATIPAGRRYEHSFYRGNWKPPPNYMRRRLKLLSIGSIQRRPYRSKPYSLPSSH